jgi:succinate dehydrogenase / fumarate reductase flavoprotein subunit
MLQVAEVLLRAALERRESRGSHSRSDFTERDDEKFLHHQGVKRNANGTYAWEKIPVTITRWVPQARVY